MPRVKREVIIEREQRAWELRQLGWTQEHIARELGITQDGVSKILARVSRRVIGNLADDVERVKRDQTAFLERIADEAMRAWERSQLDACERTTRTMSADGSNSLTEEKRTVKGQVGDQRFLAEARAAKADIRKIWGIDSPEKRDITSGGKPILFTGKVADGNDDTAQ